jgi:hypothetical protein
VKYLTFEPKASGGAARRSRFEARSLLPVSAAAVVASGVRETLCGIFAAPVVVKLFEPVLPPQHAWERILDGALLYRVNGAQSDAAIVLRPDDALGLVRAAFGETGDDAGRVPARMPSPLELELLDRLARAVAGSLGAVCGTCEPRSVQRVAAIAGFATFFELLLEQPVRTRLGIALSRDPAAEPVGRLQPSDLESVELELAARVELGTVEARAIAELACGAVVPITRANALRGSLCIGARPIVRGHCGVAGGRYAMLVEGGVREQA